MIRQAVIEDMPEILEMGKAFAGSLGIPFDEQTAVKTAGELINSADGVLLIDDGAMAGALAYPLFFNQHIKVAQELFWWVDKEKRSNGIGIQILDALELWAESIGASQLTMLAMHNSPTYVDNIYLANGYTPFERTFVKAF